MSDFRAQIETNLFGTIYRHERRLFRTFAKGRRAIFSSFSSMGGRIGPPGRGTLFGSEMGCVEGFLRSVVARKSHRWASKSLLSSQVGFRTDFAGSSTKLERKGVPNTTQNCGSNRQVFRRDYNGKQPGDPKKAAEAIVQFDGTQRKPPFAALTRQRCLSKGRRRNDLRKIRRSESLERPQPVY